MEAEISTVSEFETPETVSTYTHLFISAMVLIPPLSLGRDFIEATKTFKNTRGSQYRINYAFLNDNLKNLSKLFIF